MERQRGARLSVAVVLLVAFMLSCGGGDGGGDGSVQFDRYGGWTGISAEATGRFRVEEIDGVWWFITPDGHGFFSAGVNSVNPGGDFSPPLGTAPYHDNILAIYRTEEAWRDATLARLESWNFTTVAAFGPSWVPAGRMPYTPVRSFHSAAPAIPDWPRGQTGKLIRDYFSPDWPTGAEQVAEEVRFCSEDPYCIGMFTDNEIPWGPSALMVGTYLDAYMSLPAGAPGKLALQQLFEERYAGDIEAFNQAWSQQLTSFADVQALDSLGSDLRCESLEQTMDRRAFMARVAKRYYRVVHDALRALDPELLILGSRFTTTSLGPDVAAAAAPYVDVVSINNYEFNPEALNLFRQTGGALYEYFFLDDAFSDLQVVHDLTGKPLMITEYSYRTPTPDVLVLFPPFFPTLDTQEERADSYERYQREILSRPYMIGTHWHLYPDQPATGRPDGENSLFGLVTIEDEPYPELTQRMTELNALIPERPIPPPPPVALAASATTSRPTVTSRALIPRPHADPPPPGTLGERVFSVADPGTDRTGFFVFILSGQNLGTAVSGGPLILAGGALDADGVAPISLEESAVITMLTVTGDVGCLRFTAEGSSGSIACDGGRGHDVTVTREAGDAGPPGVVEAFLGEDSGPGAATLLVQLEVALLPTGAAVEDCLTTDQYGPRESAALSTGLVTTVKGETSLVLAGENFVCGPDGVNWRIENSPGMFVLGFPTFDGRVPGGDLAAGFKLADTGRECP